MGLYGRQMNNITGMVFQNRRYFFPWKYVRLDNLKTEIWKNLNCHFDAFHIILIFFSLRSKRHTSGLKNQLPVSRTHFRSRKPTSSIHISFSNARKYSHLKKKLITEFDSLEKIKILFSYLRWVIIVLSQKKNRKNFDQKS